MSLVEEVHFHNYEKYCDFTDGQHNMAVFGLGTTMLRHEIEIETETTLEASAPDTDN